MFNYRRFSVENVKLPHISKKNFNYKTLSIEKLYYGTFSEGKKQLQIILYRKINITGYFL